MTRTLVVPRTGTAVGRASVRDTARVVAGVLAPTIAQGVILRRRAAVALAERLDLDRRAVRTLQRLRARYGAGLLRLRLPGRRLAIVLSADDLQRIVAGAPEQFTPANREKVGALSHFQPDGVLVSRGPVRAQRRRFNEAVLDTDLPVHRLAGPIVEKVRDEVRDLLTVAEICASLDWPDFAPAYWRIVRRVVLGDAARDDHAVTDLLGRLRLDANWSSLRPVRAAVREQFLGRVGGYLALAEPGSLAGLAAAHATSAGERVRPASQLSHWLFAFDAAGIATFRALALLSSHPVPTDPAYLRASVLESVRLWPTTLAILRDTTTEVDWHGEPVPAGTGLVIHSGFFHRDDQALPHADRFAPEIWLDGTARRHRSLVPFSAGPAVCPGRNLVLLVTSTLLGALLARHEFRLVSKPTVDPRLPLPGTLNHYRMEFAVTAKPAAGIVGDGGAPIRWRPHPRSNRDSYP